MEKAFYNNKPERITYMPRKDGSADIWLRDGIGPATGENEGLYECTEVYMNAGVPKEAIEAQFEEYFNSGIVQPVSDTDRIAALEAAVMDLASMVYGGE